MEKMYSFNEIGLIPAATSSIKSRKDINICHTIEGFQGTDPITVLPIFVAPMTCIINERNFDNFISYDVLPIYPVKCNETVEDRIRISNGEWFAVTLSEFKDYFVDSHTSGEYKVLIDCAQGHMRTIYDYVEKAKNTYRNKLTVMIGNIANPYTYLKCCEVGVDYVRVGIGGGSGCTTSVQTGFHASLPWLLNEINTKYRPPVQESLRKYEGFSQFKCETKVIADGGINTIDKAIKALALGADYVMMGKLFAQCEESCGEVHNNSKIYYGQSSSQGQIDRFGYIKSNPEGNESFIPINGTLFDLTYKFKDVLQSAMSYAGAFCLDEFIGRVKYQIQSVDEFNNYYK